jgi:hypothetical protein
MLPTLGLAALLGARAASTAAVDGGMCNATTAYCYVRPLSLSLSLSLFLCRESSRTHAHRSLWWWRRMVVTQANKENLIATLTSNASACCTACLETSKCASYSHWGGPTVAGAAHCFLFSTVQGRSEGPGSDCTAGTSGRAPSPAPPHPHGPPSPPPLPPVPPSGTNFLLFLPDAVRAESLGTYGHPVAKSPAFDRLAAQGTLFQQAHTLAPGGTPSRVAMATARYVHTKNHRTTQHLVQSWESNLFGLLHDQGAKAKETAALFCVQFPV